FFLFSFRSLPQPLRPKLPAGGRRLLSRIVPLMLTCQPVNEDGGAFRRGSNRAQIHSLVGSVGSHPFHAQSVESVEIIGHVRNVAAASSSRTQSLDRTLAESAADGVLDREQRQIPLGGWHRRIPVFERDGRKSARQMIRNDCPHRFASLEQLVL